MKIETASGIIDGYADWWRSSVEMHQEGGAVRLVCPMLDRHNDHMSMYIADDLETGGYVITDIGATLGDLSASGCDVLGSQTRKGKLAQVVRGFGLQLSGEELFVKTGPDRLFPSINMLMQGMATVDDFFFTARENARSFFLDDVTKWLDTNSIRYLPDIRISGQSGFEAKFDFVIPRSGVAAPERYIKAVGSPSESSVTNALFGWNDIREARGGDAVSYLFMNSSAAAGKLVDASLVAACKSYNVRPVVWNGSADSVLEELAA